MLGDSPYNPRYFLLTSTIILKAYKNISEVEKDIDEVKVRSLQDLSFKYDLKFFEGISRILSVIISIVTKKLSKTLG